MTLRIGILGAARVAVYAMIAAAKDVDGVIVAGVAAKDRVHAADYAVTHGIPKVYESYEAIIAADDIDAIYVALPPNLHAHWSIAALQAGKPVLCEKPFALSVADAEVMLAAETKTGALLMEAQHSHYHPLSAAMRDTVQGGSLGDLLSIEAVFDAPVDKEPGEIRYDPLVGGGALWDLGVYPAHWIRSSLGFVPTLIGASHIRAPGGADIVTEARFTTESGADIRLSCNMDAPFRATFVATGNRATLSIRNPLAPHMGHAFRLIKDGITTDQQFTTRSTYALQLEAFRDAIVKGASVPTRGADSLATMHMLEAIQNAARKDD